MVLSGPTALRPGTRRARVPGPLLAALALLLPGAAAAVPPPPPERLPVLGARCDSAGFVRIVTRRSARFVRQVRLEADAVVLPGVRRAALVELGTPPESRETRLPWAEVESVSLGRSRTAQGLMIGLVVGAALGGGLVGLYGADLSTSGDHAVLAVGVLVGLGCTVLGGVVGAASPALTPLYP